MLWITYEISPIDGWDIMGGWHCDQEAIKACVVEPPSASRNEASAHRDAGSMALRHSISFLWNHGYIRNLETFPFRNLSCIGKCFGNEYAHSARLTNPCLVWKSRAKARERSQEWRRMQVGTWQVAGYIPQHPEGQLQKEWVLTPKGEERSEDSRLWKSILIHSLA